MRRPRALLLVLLLLLLLLLLRLLLLLLLLLHCGVRQSKQLRINAPCSVG
jgi:hypothetical protein